MTPNPLRYAVEMTKLADEIESHPLTLRLPHCYAPHRDGRALTLAENDQVVAALRALEVKLHRLR